MNESLQSRSARARTNRKDLEKQLEESSIARTQASRALPRLPRNPSDEYNRMSFTAMKGDKTNTGRDLWDVPAIEDYREACALGRRYADEYIKFVMEGRSSCLLGNIASHIDFRDYDRQGIWVGFFERVEAALVGRMRHG